MSRRPSTPPRRGGAFLAALLLLLALLAAACGDDRTATNDREATPDPTAKPTPDDAPVALRIASTPSADTLALHVAKAQGYFDTNDLDVTLVDVPDLADTPAGVGSQYDLALSTPTDLVRAGLAGLEVVEVAGNTISTEDNPSALVVTRPDTGITKVDQLEGRTLGTPTATGVVHAATLYWAKEEGVDLGTIKAVEAPPASLPDQLQTRQVDAVQALEPFAGQLMGAGQVSLGEPFSAIADSVPTTFWIAQGAWARQHRDVVNRFVDSLEQAQTFIEEKSPEARQVLQASTGMAADLAANIPLPTFDFAARPADLTKWVKVLEEVGQLDGEVEATRLVLAAK